MVTDAPHTVRWTIAFGILIGILGHTTLGSFAALSPGQRAVFAKRLTPRSTADLATMLQKVANYEEKVLILQELSGRKREEAEPLIAAYIRELPVKDPFVRPNAVVALARVQAEGDSTRYAEALGALLTSKETAVVDRAAFELCQLATPVARRTLFEHEATGRRTIRKARLMVDFGHLPPEEFVEAMCKSALEAITSAGPDAKDVHPVEVEPLAERAFDQKISTYMKEKLDKTSKDEQLPPLTKTHYVSFLKDAVAQTERAESYFVDKGTSRKAWAEQQVKEALKEESEKSAPAAPGQPADNGPRTHQTKIVSVKVTWFFHAKGGAVPRSVVVTDRQEIKDLLEFFPEAFSERTSDVAAGWEAEAVIEVAVEGGAARRIATNFASYSLGKGDFNVKGDVRAFMGELQRRVQKE